MPSKTMAQPLTEPLPDISHVVPRADPLQGAELPWARGHVQKCPCEHAPEYGQLLTSKPLQEKNCFLMVGAPDGGGLLGVGVVRQQLGLHRG